MALDPSFAFPCSSVDADHYGRARPLRSIVHDAPSSGDITFGWKPMSALYTFHKSDVITPRIVLKTSSSHL